MPLIQLILVLVIVGVLLWLVNNYIPMDANIKKILNIVVIIVVILWLLPGVWCFNQFPRDLCGQVKKILGRKA